MMAWNTCNYSSMNNCLYAADNCLNRTLDEKYRCIFLDRKLSSEFWTEAINIPVYINNRSSCESVNDKVTKINDMSLKIDLKNLKNKG